jgi:hypothetical protein
VTHVAFPFEYGAGRIGFNFGDHFVFAIQHNPRTRVQHTDNDHNDNVVVLVE